ncbi:LysR family transcriptional regulator [Mycobacterium montefiorense]|uniref:LysR family transcriptional regulator n=2 Tax=Mycobacterium montefiorense TaxID=154654 RepID=UPI0021F26F1D|nr:LysR family transcriptional regulator [Mycobacterium montefiorense]MCV7425957.1 LysR family transcriptional regulator [Mycobacterium montefiorense]
MATLRALECLVALVDHGSVSAAAAALHMSQPAVSHQIAILEKELDTPAADRLWRGMRITVAGRAAAEEARVALRAAERAIWIGRRVARADAGRIRISCVETMTTWLLLPVLRHWRSRRPGVHLELSEFTSDDAMLDLLEAGQTDVIFGSHPTQATDAGIEVFGKQEVVVVAAPGHPFTGMSAVPFHDLQGKPFVHYDQENALAVWIDQLAARHEVELNPVLRTRSARTAVQLAGAGMGITIAPVSALPSRPAGTVRRLRPGTSVDVVGILAAPSDTLVCKFVADIRRRGLPAWTPEGQPDRTAPNVVA